MDELDEHLTRVYVYANESYHQDTADAKYQGYAAKADSVRVAAASSISFAEPEILAISENVVDLLESISCARSRITLCK